MDDQPENYLLINPQTYWPDKAIWNGVTYEFMYFGNYRNRNGEYVECEDFPAIGTPLDKPPHYSGSDHSEARQAAENYIQNMKVIFEKAERYDDLTGSGNV